MRLRSSTGTERERVHCDEMEEQGGLGAGLCVLFCVCALPCIRWNGDGCYCSSVLVRLSFV